MAFENSAFVWIEVVKSKSSLTWDVQTCVRIFFHDSLCFHISHSFVRPSRSRFSVDKQLFALKGAACILDENMDSAHRSENTSCGENARHLVSHALDDNLRGKSHPQQRHFHVAFFSFTFTDPLALCVFGIIQDFVNAIVDVSLVDFLSKNKSSTPVNMPALAISAAMSVQTSTASLLIAIQFPVNGFDHNSTTNPAIFLFFPPSQLPTYGFPFFFFLDSLNCNFPVPISHQVCEVVSLLVVLPENVLHIVVDHFHKVGFLHLPPRVQRLLSMTNLLLVFFPSRIAH